MKSAAEIRQEFLEFFRKHDHQIVPSSPVIPQNDPTLLFTNAGMNQFKRIFLGLEEASYPRVADTQKCIRVSGKHNDLEEVGRDTYHHTFFEMLGNWSFGDYYKAEAIKLAWQLFTEVWRFSKERLWATVYRDDDEAAEAWLQVTDIVPERILRFGEKDNFWEMGETGPCGPCSEIHYYVGDNPQQQRADQINAGNPEYIELWNLVFIQYNRDKDGNLELLPKKHVDTGAGLERIVAALQGKKSNYDTDLFQPIIKRIEELSGVAYQEVTGMPHRVLADHVRMLTFAIADGGLPSNDGRGYVIRRILRRAARYARMLDQHEPIIYRLVEPVVMILGDVFPEIRERQAHVERVIKSEEKLFGATLDRGLEVFEKVKNQLLAENSTIFPGAEVFRLYDTYGFPFDLTRLMAEESGLKIDEAGFNTEMERQRERARAAVNFQDDFAGVEQNWQVMTEGEHSLFVGYDQQECAATIRSYAISGETIYLVLDQTPFYAESGGEIGDQGYLEGEDFKIAVTDTRKSGEKIIHIGQFLDGSKITSPTVKAVVDPEFDQKVRCNHTATHLLHAALRRVLGEHVHQAGSLVAPDRLRFDFTHFTKLSDEEILQVEELVNAAIRANQVVDITYSDYNEARQSGAMALFGEKYDQIVRVISVADFSKELCGGKHVRRTGDIGCFMIISEGAVAAGVRRIEALTAAAAYRELRENLTIVRNLERLLETTREQVMVRITKLIDDNKIFEKELAKFQLERLKQDLIAQIEQAETIGALKVCTVETKATNMDELKQLGDALREKLDLGVGILTAVWEDKPGLVVVVTDQAIRKYGIKAGELVKSLGRILGGGGGGRDHLATAGGRFVEQIPTVFQEAKKILKSKISER
jgi:alanyl-tRNA synthetase